MTVDRTCPNEEAPILSIHYADPSASPTSSAAPTESTTSTTTPSKHSPTDTVRIIDMKMRTDSQILEELVRLTKATPVEISQEDKDTWRRLEEQKRESEKNRKGSLAVKAKVQREKELLKQAQGEMEAS